MPATTTLLGLVTPTQGTLTGTWGDTVNYGISDYLDIAIAGTLSFAGDGAITLANTTGSSSGNSIGATTAQYAIIRVTGTLTTVKIITGPSYSKTYLVVNAATGSTVTFKASGQTGVSIAVGETALVYYDGTDYVKVVGTATAGAAGGSTTQVQYNNAGVLAGITGATSNGTALTLVAPNLGSPASVGTMPAFTLGGTVSGGGNQINNVVIGASNPLAGAFTSLTASTTLGVTGVSTLTGGAIVQGLTVGLGAGAVATNTAVGVSALTSNSTGAQNTAIGYQAGYTNQTGTGNVFVGRVAAYATTTSYNTAVGMAALYINNTGANNTAIGTEALYSNLSASNNTAVGFQAGLSSTAASNVYVGAQAGYLSTTSNSTAVGYQAHYRNLTGNNSVAIGYQALYGGASADADGCVAVGHESLLSVTTGDFNVALGMGTLRVTSSGANNVALGYQSLNANTTASNNTAVGFQSLYTNTTGASNTAVGYQSLPINTASNNTATGFQAGNGVTSATNMIAIGYRSMYGNSGFITGGSNIGIGNETFYNLTSGTNNVAIGYQSLYANNAASNNTAVGYQAGYSNTESAAQTALGHQALYSLTGAFNGGNTAVGQGAGYSQTSGYTNTYVGYNSGYVMLGGVQNTILGSYSGNQDGLDIRNSNNYVVLSDGAGARQITMAEGQTLALDSAVPNTGTGITFPATQSASANANTLDDYEEGTWTPVPARYTGGAITTSGGSITATGTYTKIGKQVTITARIILSGTLTQGSSDTIITGIPFNSSEYSAMSIGSASCMTNYPFQTSQQGLWTDSSVSGFSFQQANAWVTGGNLLFSGTYFV